MRNVETAMRGRAIPVAIAMTIAAALCQSGPAKADDGFTATVLVPLESTLMDAEAEKAEGELSRRTRTCSGQVAAARVGTSPREVAAIRDMMDACVERVRRECAGEAAGLGLSGTASRRRAGTCMRRRMGS